VGIKTNAILSGDRRSIDNQIKIMKTKIIGLIFLLLVGRGFAQGFANLNFENAQFTVDSSGNFFGGTFYPYAVYASSAVPGWTAYLDSVPQTDILSNDATLGSAMVSLQGTNLPYYEYFLLPAFQGRWSILLQGLLGDTNLNNGTYPVIASIGQTGQIPASAESLLFWGNLSLASGNNFDVSFDGQDLSLVAISNALNYTVYGADVSAFAGQTGQLLFSAGNNTFAELDNISFSTEPVPEPSEIALVALGTLFLALRRWKSNNLP
jgi:hypothetical protein